MMSLFLSPFPGVLSAGQLEFSFEKGALSLKADKVPLQTILLEIVRSGVTVKIDPQINPPVTVNFKDRPIGQALENLLKPVSYSLLWESPSGTEGKENPVLVEIQVFLSEKKELMKKLVPERDVEIVKNNEGVFYVKDELLLYLFRGTDIQKLKELLKTYNAELFFDGVPPGPARILLPPDSDVFAIARTIKNKLNINISQPNYAYPLEPPVQYKTALNLNSINTEISSYVMPEQGYAIAIFDSGLAENTGLDNLVKSSLDIMNPDVPITDTLGHGTQMAYIASGIVNPYGVESDSTSYMPIIPVRAFDDNGYTTDFNILNSINFALENNARVISLSWGTETRSAFMENSFEYAREKGLVIVASAGNAPTGIPVYPAAYPSVIGVGALEPHGKTWENSNYGNFVSLYAPGFATLPVGYKGEPGLYAGTSIATAHVANSIADYLSRNPAAGMKEIQEFLDSRF
ncbi:S8 family serine peptidase [Thermodesulfobacteriota bacterium]